MNKWTECRRRQSLDNTRGPKTRMNQIKPNDKLLSTRQQTAHLYYEIRIELKKKPEMKITTATK